MARLRSKNKFREAARHDSDVMKDTIQQTTIMSIMREEEKNWVTSTNIKETKRRMNTKQLLDFPDALHTKNTCTPEQENK